MNENERNELIAHIGGLLARGETHEVILGELTVDPSVLTEEEATQLLRDVYDTWKETSGSLGLDLDDIRNWHARIRMRLLKTSLKDESVKSVRASLAILDSLAQIQGVIQKTELVSTQPIRISLVPVEEKE